MRDTKANAVLVSPLKRTVLVFLLRELRVSELLDKRIEF